MLDELTAEELIEPAVEREQHVTALELFFDLVFVFAITEVSSFLYRHPSWLGLVEAFAILMALWFAWTGYAWLGNTAGTDERPVRVVLLAAMVPLVFASVAVPHAFSKDALLFGVAYFFVRALHIAAYAVLARGNPALSAAVFRLARTILPAAGFLVLAGVFSGTGRALCWIAALLIDYGGLMVSSTEGWRVEPGHFAERHGLIIIIALGESIVALGVGASLGVHAGVLVAVALGLAVAACLWWAYFDVVSTVAERKLREAGPQARARIARDSYSYLHLPMVAGIVIFAFGAKTTLTHLHVYLHVVPAVALCGGVALYLLALSAFKRRNVGSFNNPRLVAATGLALLIPASATVLPGLLSLALVAGTCCALITYEVFRYAEARDRIRHGYV
jgi:low temperature requirement protein LtrA